MDLIDQFTAVFEAKGCNVSRSLIENAERLQISMGGSIALLDFFRTGTIRPGGKKSPTLELVKEILESYRSDAKYLSQILLQEKSEHGDNEDLESSIIDYKSNLIVTDESLTGTMISTLRNSVSGLESKGATFLESERVYVGFRGDRVVVEGLASEVDIITKIMTAHGARLEESVYTLFKDRLHKTAARWSFSLPIKSDENVKKLLGRELYDFLPAHDRRAFISALTILEVGFPVPEIAPIVMPVGRAFEGFLGKLLLKIGIITEVNLTDPQYNLGTAFDSKDAKAFKARVPTHEPMLDALKQRMKEHRHIRLHSQASKWMQGNVDDANRFINRVADDMKEYHGYFKNYFAS